MASVEKRTDGRYRARWREFPGGPQRARHFARKIDAERFLDGIRGDLVRGEYIDPTAGRVCFREYAESWRRVQVHRPSTEVLVESHLRLHVLPFFGERPIASIRPSEIQAWVKGRSAELAPTTVMTVYRFAAAIFRSAVRDRIIAKTPCEQIKLPKINRLNVVPLETAAVVRLADAMPDRYRSLVILVAGSGLRQGEAFGLDVRHIDFLGRSLRVEQQLISLPRREAFLGPPKTASSVRTVPLPSVVVDELARHFERLDLQCEGQLVFTNAQGAPIRRSGFAEVWQRAIRAALLPAGTRFHDLRHYYASLLIRHGESVKVVQSRLGHASASETLDTYSHLWPDSEDQTRQALELALGAWVPTSTRAVGGGG